MFFNLMLNADSDFIPLFFQRYTSCNTLVESILLPRPSSNPRITRGHVARFEQPLTQTFTKFLDIVRFFEGLALSIPDRVLTMKNAVVITRSNSFKTEVVVDFRIQGTKIFDVDPAEMAALLESMKEKMGGIENIRSEDLAIIMKDLFTPNPKPMVADGRYILTINDYRESCKIDKIVLQSCPIHD